MSDLAHQPPAFGTLLRRWRQARRLSQADLALQVETPPRHLSFLETGRANPSREMVARLWTALDVPLGDRNTLLRAAGFADVYAAHDLQAPALDALRAALAHILAAHEPNPALVIDRAWFVRDVNAAGARLLGRHGRAPRPSQEPGARWDGEGPNVLDLVFGPDGMRDALVNFEEAARYFIQRLHRETLTPEDLAAALARIERFGPLPSHWWALDAGYRASPVFPIQVRLGGDVLSFFSILTTVASPMEPVAQELRVETLFPGDAPTRRALELAASEPPCAAFTP